jgi:hypothetical protein
LTLINIRRRPSVGTCYIGFGRRQWLIGFNWQWPGDKTGEAPRNGSGD